MASGSKTSSTNEVDLPTESTTDKESLLRTLIRYTMRTFYDLPLSFIVEYIYYYKCINLEDLAELLQLNPKQVYSYIEQLKRDRFIIEEHRSESKNKFDPSVLYYKIDIARLINVIKYRLIKMRLEIEDFEKVQPMLYKCEKCSKEYSEFDMVKLFQNSLGEDLICAYCPGLVKENNPTEQESIPCDMRLFSQQMELLFQTLEKLDQIIKNEPLTTVDCDVEMTTDKYSIDMDTDTINSNQVKPLPEWFTRPIESNQSHS